jgi:uracil-DNA glycosylase
MRDSEKLTVDSMIDWWTEAGLVDPVKDEPCAWLQPLRTEAVQSVLASPTTRAPQPPATPEVAMPRNLPDSLPAFEAWLRDDPALVGGLWSHQRILPLGPENAPLMVLSDMPDVDDFAAGHLLAGPIGELFDAMLAAIGLQRSTLRLASVALTRPAGGRWDDGSTNALRDIALHHIALAKPQRLLLLGQQTCRLLTGDDVPADGHGLRNINHYGVTTAAVAIHHPRLLLTRQALKRGAWTALKQLREPA